MIECRRLLDRNRNAFQECGPCLDAVLKLDYEIEQQRKEFKEMISRYHCASNYKVVQTGNEAGGEGRDGREGKGDNDDCDDCEVSLFFNHPR